MREDLEKKFSKIGIGLSQLRDQEGFKIEMHNPQGYVIKTERQDWQEGGKTVTTYFTTKTYGNNVVDSDSTHLFDEALANHLKLYSKE